MIYLKETSFIYNNVVNNNLSKLDKLLYRRCLLSSIMISVYYNLIKNKQIFNYK